MVPEGGLVVCVGKVVGVDGQAVNEGEADSVGGLGVC